MNKPNEKNPEPQNNDESKDIKESSEELKTKEGTSPEQNPESPEATDSSEEKTDNTEEPINESDKESEESSESEPPEEKTDDFHLGTNLAQLNKLFVICSDDTKMRSNLESFLQPLGITPIFTHQKKGAFKPIAEMYNVNQGVNFAIALLNADNFSYLREQGNPNTAIMTSDSKVIFELGYCIGKLGRERVIGLYYDQKSYRCPTEFFDVMYIPYNKNNLWKEELKTKLSNAGFALSN